MGTEPWNIGALRACVTLTEQDVRDAARLLSLIADSVKTPSLGRIVANLGPDDRQDKRARLVLRARQHLHERQLRKQFLSRAVFGEPAWDSLLVLYISEFEGRRLTLRGVADEIQEPISSTQRWIGYLEKERLVEKEGHPTDRRMSHVALLNKGRETLDAYLAAIDSPDPSVQEKGALFPAAPFIPNRLRD